MAVNLWLPYRPQFSDGSGNPYSGAQLFFYTAGSSVKQNTYTNSGGATPNSNPMIMDAAGRPTQAIWLTASVTYKVGLALATESDPPSAFIWEIDGVTGIGDVATTTSEWISGPAPTYVSSTSFTLVGDQTSIFTVGRRVKVTDSGGTKYGTIASSVFGALTTITITGDALATPTSAVSYGLLNPTNTSIPWAKNTVIDAAGDGIIGTAADTSARAPLIYGKIIHGLTYDNGTDATNDININTGGAMDATGARWMRLATALGKQSDVAWAVGGTTAAPLGGLDTGAVGNSDYYIWLIARSDTGVVDALFSLSSTAPTMPANYDFKRLIGWFKRVGVTIVAFDTYETEGGGIEMNWRSPTLDINLASTLTTSRRTDAVKVPLNFSTIASIYVQVYDAAATHASWVGCPDVTDAAPVNQTATCNINGDAAGRSLTYKMSVRTSSTGTIAARSSLATVDFYVVTTEGFNWARRN